MTITDTHQPDDRATHRTAPRLYTLDEAAELLRVSKWTVQRLIQAAQLGSLKVGVRTLVSEDDLTKFIAEQRTGRIRRSLHE